MPTLKFTAAAVNPPLLDRELRAAISAPYDGLSLSAEDGLLVYVTDGHDAEALRPAIAAVLAAHDPAVLTAEQQLQARRIAAQGEVGAADFLAVLNQINAAASLADAKPILRSLLRLMYRIALADGLTDAENPEG